MYEATSPCEYCSSFFLQSSYPQARVERGVMKRSYSKKLDKKGGSKIEHNSGESTSKKKPSSSWLMTYIMVINRFRRQRERHTCTVQRQGKGATKVTSCQSYLCKRRWANKGSAPTNAHRAVEKWRQRHPSRF